MEEPMVIQCYNNASQYLHLSKIEEVEKIEMICVHTYADTLIERNKHHDIVNIEHDIVCEQEDIDEIEACPEPLCVFNYSLYPVATALPLPVLAHRNRMDNNHFAFIPDDYEGDYVDYAGFGFIKFAKGILGKISFTEKEREWHSFDSRVSEKFFKKGIKFHLHHKVLKHLHK